MAFTIFSHLALTNGMVMSTKAPISFVFCSVYQKYIKSILRNNSVSDDGPVRIEPDAVILKK